MTTDVHECVQRGVEWLDASTMKDWWSERYIDLSELDMSSEQRCVLGQLARNHPDSGSRPVCGDHNCPRCTSELGYYDMLDGHRDIRVRTMGFESGYSANEYPELNRAWRTVITERRARDEADTTQFG